MLILATDYFGVFSPNGELEAVEMTHGSAVFAAANLSPDKNNPNRTIRPVWIALPPEDAETAAETIAA